MNFKKKSCVLTAVLIYIECPLRTFRMLCQPPADEVVSVALVDAGDPGVPPVVPGVALTLQGLHHLLPQPVHRAEYEGVQGPAKHRDREASWGEDKILLAENIK